MRPAPGIAGEDGHEEKSVIKTAVQLPAGRALDHTGRDIDHTGRNLDHTGRRTNR
jgi:hypothetical protein